MQFHIDLDNDEVIAGWLIPDNPNTMPTFVICSPGQPNVTLSANVPRPDIKELGHHNTGMVGFVVNETILPGLSQLDELQIRDGESGILIYRRRKGLPQRIFCYDLAMLSLTMLAEKLLNKFTLCYNEIQQHPFDTAFSILNNQSAPSVFGSGRPPLARYNDLLRKNNFTVIALLQHPQENLAQRLLLARKIATGYIEYDMEGLEPLVELARKIPLDHTDALETALAKIAETHPTQVVNPFVRTLACGPDERPEQRHVAIALNNLAAMDLVGLSGQHFETFRSILAEMLADDILEGISPERSDELGEMTRRVAAMPGVRKLQSLDMSLYSYVEEALEVSTRSGSNF